MDTRVVLPRWTGLLATAMVMRIAKNAICACIVFNLLLLDMQAV